MANTARLNLDLIAANQAQKHVPANEAYAKLDTLVQTSVLDKDLTAPSGSPSEGDCYIVAAGATGAWAGQDKAIARYEDGAWRFFSPGIGWRAWVQDETELYAYSGAGGGDWAPSLDPRLAGVVEVTTADLNTLVESGWYRLQNTNANAPPISWNWSTLFVSRGFDTIWQMVIDYATNTTWVRGGFNPHLGGGATWQSWSQLARLDAANTWTGTQTMNGFAPSALVYNDSGGGVGPLLTMWRDSSSPAATDNLGRIDFSGRDSAGNYQNYAHVGAYLNDPTDTSEDASVYIAAIQGGAYATVAWFGNGAFMQGASGGFKGPGTFNAAALYDDGVAVCPALRAEFLERGTVDLDFWDATVPDIEIPERVENVPVFDEAEEEVEIEEDRGDCIVCRTEVRMVRREKVERVPLVDADGAPVLAADGSPKTKDRPLTEERLTPARTIKRRHEAAHRFKAMLDDGFDPRDPKQYIAKLRADQALPGMPTVEEFTTGAKISLTEKFERLWLALEFLALVVIDQEERIKKVEIQLGGKY